ncbi:MAG: HAD hydrolase-like protein [Bacteroidia bacterium]|nr:HAD hydrolase-like protein [Bacteroidia bacterium]
MKFPIRLVVMDIAGTTVKDDGAVNAVFRTVLQSEGIDIAESDADAVMGMSKPVAIGALLEKYGLTADRRMVESLHARFVEQMTEHYRTRGVKPTKGAENTLDYLKRRGITVFLDTGFDRSVADAILASLQWQERGLIAGSVTSDEVERGRPFPDMIFRAMALAGVNDPASVAKVGDTVVDLEQGRTAGCGLIVGVLSGSGTREQLIERPHDFLLPDVSFLPAVLEGTYAGS